MPFGDRLGAGHRSPYGSAAVGVPTVVDVEHVDDSGALIDAIADAVLASSRAPLAGEWRAQWCTDTVWILRQWAEQEFDAGCGRGLRQALSQLPCGRAGHDDPEAHSADPDRRAVSSARTWASSRTSPRSISSSARAMRDWASGSPSSSKVASMDSRSSAASSTT